MASEELTFDAKYVVTLIVEFLEEDGAITANRRIRRSSLTSPDDSSTAAIELGRTVEAGDGAGVTGVDRVRTRRGRCAIDEPKSKRLQPLEASNPPIWLQTRVAAIEFRCAPPSCRRIMSKGLGSWECRLRWL
jgi:hypothetical protein